MSLSWADISRGGVLASEFRRRGFTGDGAFVAACEVANAYPVELRSLAPNIAALRQYAALLKLTGTAIEPELDPKTARQVPVGYCGPLVFLAHYDPAADCPLPTQLVQRLVISPDAYLEVRKAFLSQSGLFADLHREPVGEKNPVPSLEGLTDERSALRWLLEAGLVSKFDQGAVRASLAEKVFSSDKLSSEYRVVLAKLSGGKKIGSHQISKSGGLSLAAIPTSIQEKFRFLPFAAEGQAIYLFVPPVEESGMLDAVSSRVPSKAIRVVVSREHLTLLSQSPAANKRSPTDAGPAAASVATGGIAIEVKEVERFDPAASEDNKLTVQRILWDATNRGASDIHIEGFLDSMRVRLAVDGSGMIALQLPLARLRGITAILKGYCNIPLDGSRHADGRFSFSLGNRPIDVRAALVISGSGSPKWTLRLLDKSVGVRTTAQLGLEEEDLRALRSGYSNKFGLMLASGPTGHGKSTTLYACLQDLIRPDRFIYSLEDPIEFDIPGVTQIQVTSDEAKLAHGDVSFASGTKMLLRSDPDVIMVGEIRDETTAIAALQAAMTGHLLISTLHANDAPSVVGRLGELLKRVDGAQGLLASSLVMASSQRLIRRLCTCHGIIPTPLEVREVFNRKGIAPPKYLHTAEGCDGCGFTGYRQRSLLMEFLPLNEEIRDAISSGARPGEIRKIATAAGYVPIYHRGLSLVAAGITSYEEVINNCVSGI